MSSRDPERFDLGAFEDFLDSAAGRTILVIIGLGIFVAIAMLPPF